MHTINIKRSTDQRCAVVETVARQSSAVRAARRHLARYISEGHPIENLWVEDPRGNVLFGTKPSQPRFVN